MRARDEHGEHVGEAAQVAQRHNAVGDLPHQRRVAVGGNQDDGGAGFVPRQRQGDRAITVGDQQDEVPRPAPPGVGQEAEVGASVAQGAAIEEKQRVVAGVGHLGAVIEEDADRLAAGSLHRQGDGLGHDCRANFGDPTGSIPLEQTSTHFLPQLESGVHPKSNIEQIMLHTCTWIVATNSQFEARFHGLGQG